MSLAARLYAPLRERFHSARADLFVRLARPRPGARLLDLGGGDGSFAARLVERVPMEVTVAEPDVTRNRAAERGFEVREVTPGRPLPFEDGEFDLVLCNSVIEHATFWEGQDPSRPWTDRAREAQTRFASEIRRVAPAWFVQTPHADFPVDAHLWLPGTNWLPHGVLERLIPFTDRFWIKHCGVADWRLLRSSELRSLFPDGQTGGGSGREGPGTAEVGGGVPTDGRPHLSSRRGYLTCQGLSPTPR